MHHALRREVVQRERVARAAAAVGLGRIGRPRIRRRRRQRLVRQQVAAGARPLHMRRRPDFRSPVHGFSRIVQRGAQRDMHRRAERLEAEFLLAPPLHADAVVGNLQRDHRGIHRDIVRAVVAIAAGAMRMAHGDRVLRDAQHIRQRVAQRIDALRMRPHRQMPAAILRQRAGRPHRGVRDIGPRIARGHDVRRSRPPATARRCSRSSHGWPTSHAASCCSGGDLPHVVPLRMHRRGRGGALHHRLIGCRRTPRSCRRARCGTRRVRRAAAPPRPATASCAPRHGWRRMRACSMSGRTMSCTKAAPATFAGRSRRGIGLPT